jgi:hypothetical protein
VLCLGFRGSMVFCIEKPYAFLATLLSWNFVFAIHMAWFEGELVLYLVYLYILFFSYIFLILS